MCQNPPTARLIGLGIAIIPFEDGQRHQSRSFPEIHIVEAVAQQVVAGHIQSTGQSIQVVDRGCSLSSFVPGYSRMVDPCEGLNVLLGQALRLADAAQSVGLKRHRVLAETQPRCDYPTSLAGPKRTIFVLQAQ